MANHRRSKKDRQSRRDAAQRAVRLVGLSSAACTFLTVSLSPLVNMPVAKADGEDVIIDQIINSLSAVDPTAGLDLSSWLSSLDAALQGAANFDPLSSTPLPGLSALGAVPDRRLSAACPASALGAAARSVGGVARLRPVVGGFDYRRSVRFVWCVGRPRFAVRAVVLVEPHLGPGVDCRYDLPGQPHCSVRHRAEHVLE